MLTSLECDNITTAAAKAFIRIPKLIALVILDCTSSKSNKYKTAPIIIKTGLILYKAFIASLLTFSILDKIYNDAARAAITTPIAIAFFNALSPLTPIWSIITIIAATIIIIAVTFLRPFNASSLGLT